MYAAALATSLSVLSWFSAPALPDACPLQKPVVSVLPLSPGFEVDHDRSRVELGRMIGAKAFPGFYTQGLTEVDYVTRPRLLIETQQLAVGRWCSSLKRISVEFGLPVPAKVHLASEIPEGSCRYVSILAHEMRHVAISQKAVAEGADALRDALRKGGDGYFAYGEDDAASSTGLKAMVERAVSDVTARYLARAELENGLIDTKSSYRALGEQCPGAQD